MSILEKKSIGLDIADCTIEVVELSKSSLGGVKINKLGRTILPFGLVKSGRIINEEGLKDALSKLFAQTKPKSLEVKKICFGLPDSQIYTHTFTLPPHKPEERSALVTTEALSSIPLEEGDLLYSYQVLATTESGVDILLVATSSEVVSEWSEFFRKMGIAVETFDLESLALIRGLSLKSPSSIAIFDIGSMTTNVFIFNNKGLSYAHSFNKAGYYLTEKISKELGLSLAEAEARKIKFGVAYPKDTVYPVVKEFLDEILGEIQESLDFFEKKNKEKIGGFVVVGGTGQMFGLLDYFQKKLGKAGLLGQAKLIKNKVPLEYIEAVGLALRSLDSNYKDELVINLNVSSFEQKMEKEIKPATLALASEEKAEVEIGDRELLESLAPPEIKEEKVHSRLLLLLDVVIVGAILIGVAWQYSNYNETARQQATQSSIIHFENLQTFNFTEEVAVSGSEYLPQRVRGKIIRTTVSTSTDFNAAVVFADESLKKELKSDENYFKEPLNKSLMQQKNSYPMIFEWLVYEQQTLLESLAAQMDKINSGHVPYSFDSIENTAVEPTSNSNVFLLKSTVKAYVNETLKP